MNTMQITHIKHPTLEDFENKACHEILNCAQKSISLRDKFSIVLCGGNTPKGIFKKLAMHKADWNKWHIYFGDERCLEKNNPDRNSMMANEAWLNHVPIMSSHKYFIDTELGPEKAANNYEQLLSNISTFDLVLLGFGDDGHVASLFPEHHWDNSRSVTPVYNAPKLPRERVSLTPKRLSKARKILFLVTGSNKQTSFNRWMKKKDLPAACVCAEEEIKILSYDLL